MHIYNICMFIYIYIHVYIYIYILALPKNSHNVFSPILVSVIIVCVYVSFQKPLFTGFRRVPLGA